MTAVILTNNHEETGPIGGALTSFEDPVSSHLGDAHGLDDQLSATTSPSSSASNAALLPGTSFTTNLSNLHISKTMVDGSRGQESPSGMHHLGLRLSSQVFSPKAVSSYHTLLNLLEKQRDVGGGGGSGTTSYDASLDGNGAIDSAATSEPSSISITPERSVSGSPTTRSASVPCLSTAVKECLLAKVSSSASSLPPSRLGSSLGCKRRKRIPLRSPRSSFDSTDIPGIVFTFQSSPVLKVLHLPMDYTNLNHQGGGTQSNTTAALSLAAYTSSSASLSNQPDGADPNLSDGAFSDDDYDGSFHGGGVSGGTNVVTGRPSRAATAGASSAPGPKDTQHHVTHHRRPTSKKPPLNARVCASCSVSKTPYWREAWDPYIVLCNACGLRFSKFKKRCIKCNYVPRKDDKGGRCCPICSGEWA